jgi:hypothetical protein
MLPSLARLPQQPTGAQLSSDKFKAIVRFIRGNPDRMALKVDSEGDVSPEDMEILTRWVVGAFDVLDQQPFSNFVNHHNSPTYSWIQMTHAEFGEGVRKLGCSETYWQELYAAQDARYHIEREELSFPDTSGATTWRFVVAITRRQ